jgi:hypothetical protein
MYLLFPGSYTARALAGLLARIGIPRNVNQKSLKKLYKMYLREELKQPGVAEQVMAEYNCKLSLAQLRIIVNRADKLQGYRNVQIEALIVGSSFSVRFAYSRRKQV